MILAVCSFTVVAGLIYAMATRKKQIARKLQEWKYDYKIQDIGLWAMIDDIAMKKRNKLEDIPDVTGRIAVVTGGARGIGYHVVKELVQRGMKVVLGVRNVEAGKKMGEDFKNEGLSGSVHVHKLDVSSVNSVEKFAKIVTEEYPRVNVLVNNAGIMFGDYRVTEDGFESQLATNYLGHFLLTHLLLPSLKAAGEELKTCARVVNVSSCAHKSTEIFFEDINMKHGYMSSAAYGQSKLAQIMSARHMDRLLQARGDNVHCYSVHPGVVDTDLFQGTTVKKYSQWFMNIFFKKPEEGAISILYTCLSPRLEDDGGRYVSNCRKGSDSEYSRKEKEQEKLFEITCALLKVKNFGTTENT